MIYHLLLLIFLGLITSYTDIKEGKIRNKHLLFFLTAAIFINGSLFFLGQVNLEYLKYFLLNVLIGLVVGFFLWFVGLWGAGDAKLYALFVTLVPIYRDAFLLVIVNTVLPLFFYYFVMILFKSDLKQKKESILKVLNYKYILYLIVTVFSLGWVSQLFFGILGIASNYIFSIIFMILVALGIDAISKRIEGVSSWQIYVAISLIRIVFRYKMLTFQFWLSFLLMTIGFALIRLVLFDLGIVFADRVKIKDLFPGMIPAELITKEFRKVKGSAYSLSQMPNPGMLFDVGIEGFTKQDVLLLKKLDNEGKLNFDFLLIQQSIPFAPFLFIGALITFLFGNIINILIGIL